MIDIITYIPDLAAFRVECQAKAEAGNKFFTINDEVLTYNVAQIPVAYNGNTSVCLVRLVTGEEIEEFDSLASCERIGICEDNAYIFDAGGEDIYNTVYDQSPIVIDEETTYTPPQMIGVFA